MKALLEKYNVIKTGHFKLTSGKHSNQYINKDAIYSNPMLFNNVIMKMVRSLDSYFNMFDVITGPAIAGAILAAPISVQIFSKIFVYPEKIDGKMVFRRGYDRILEGKRVWIIEDVITTGGSVEKTIMAIRDCKGRVAGISVIWNRGIWFNNFMVLSLIKELVPSYWPDECPLCRRKIPLQDPKGA